MTSEEASPDAKRRRIAAAEGGGCPQNNIRRLTDLPSGILAHAASFLSAPSRVLFAIALDGDAESSTINERSSAIAGNQWDVLDFGEIEKEVAKKLTDTDVTKALLCIGAVSNLKRLKLTNCTNITGTCLEPLRGSVVIEQIDLSLGGDNRTSVSPLSCGHVLPILDSIIDGEGCALKHFHFPSAWRKQKRPTGSEFHAFIGRYNQMRRNWGTVNCLECSGILPEEGEWIETSTFSEYYGIQLHTCCGCLKHYCHGCNIDGEGKDMLQECNMCGRDYCKGCSGVTECYGYDCDNDICDDCYKNECCVGCNRASCSECVQEGVLSVHKCDFCDKCYCRGCYDNDVADIFYSCSRCKERCCIECLLQRYRRGQLGCARCIKAIAPHRRLVDENKQLQEENEQLKAEVEALKRQIEAAGG